MKCHSGVSLYGTIWRGRAKKMYNPEDGVPRNLEIRLQRDPNEQQSEQPQCRTISTQVLVVENVLGTGPPDLTYVQNLIRHRGIEKKTYWTRNASDGSACSEINLHNGSAWSDLIREVVIPASASHYSRMTDADLNTAT